MIDVAISSWSLHTLFLNPGITGMSAENFPRIASRYFGVRHLEYFEGDYALDLARPGFDDDHHAGMIRQACDREGVKVVCLAAINDFTNDDEEQRANDRDRILRLARHCEVLGCPIIRVNSGRLRLDDAHAALLADELRRLSDALDGRAVRLAIENHPQVLDSHSTSDRLLHVVETIGRENVRLCPDVGAMVPGYWRQGLKRLAPLAAHVHVKPFVLGGLGIQLRIPEYGPAVREILDECGYSGAVTLEYLPSLELLTPAFCQESRRSLLELARVFDYQAVPDPEWGEDLYKPPERDLHRNSDPALSPPSSILQLLADGCELRLGARIEIHDFATSHEVKSKGFDYEATGRQVRPSHDTSGPPDGPHFCHLASKDPIGADECRRFHDQKLALIREGLQADPRVCICPFGLILLLVPINDESNAYGLISSGPWVEQGTEGMIVDGILRLISPEGQAGIEEASMRIDTYSHTKLAANRSLLVNLAQNLGSLYKEREVTHRYLIRGPQIINQIREKSYSDHLIELDEFITRLGETFLEFERVVRFGQLALYRRQELDQGREVLRLVLPASPRGGLPAEVPLPSPKGRDRAVDTQRELRRAVEAATGQSYLLSERRESNVILVFGFPPEVTVAGHPSSNLFEQFASEVHYILMSLRNLMEAETGRQELAMFIDRFKHAISSPLQGISDRILQLRSGLEGNRTISYTRLRELVADLRDFSNEAGSILDRFTGRVRLQSHGSLRPQLNFSRIDPIKIIEESVRKLSRSAVRRKIRIVPPASITPAPLIEGDPEAFSEVFDNLIENAVKFARDGSVVTVQSVASGEVTTPPWELEVPGRRFIVRDFGLGILPDDFPRIFKPYVQGRAFSPNRVIRGTGLGLAICRQIVELHGGSIVITSRPISSTEGQPRHEDIQECIVEVVVDLPLQAQRDAASVPFGGE
jgi:signal transduction histidine kinase/sugar phosphate isomerase/epimerase